VTTMATNKQRLFKDETEEAKWWTKNQEFIADQFEKARATGKLGSGTVAKLARERVGAAPTITIRLAGMDLARARILAAEKGLRYQTYLKMLLHQALNSEERKAGRRSHKDRREIQER
jgi:predicted DNA binding CopG/RHH family protein